MAPARCSLRLCRMGTRAGQAVPHASPPAPCPGVTPSTMGMASVRSCCPGPFPSPQADEAAPDPGYSPAARKPSCHVSDGRGAAGGRTCFLVVCGRR